MEVCCGSRRGCACTVQAAAMLHGRKALRCTLVPSSTVSVARTVVHLSVQTHPVSFCRIMSPALPVCLPVLPPSTTNRSSWKNWLTTVCLCTAYQQALFMLLPIPAPQRHNQNPFSFFSILFNQARLTTTPSLSKEKSNPPSAPATPSTPSASTPAPSAPPSPPRAPETHPAPAASHTPGNCRRRTVAIGAAGSGRVIAPRRLWAQT